jgi:outer membrane protein assembly factor BamB
VGHGLVTYAQPEGWGRDKGVVVIRHNFSDESTILSFYGHLDPPSVTLAAGECVARGDMIGKIGRPSSPPHLHLEVRSHLPYQPGTGYWSTDPAQAGWEPPSQFISNKRIVASPGVAWARPPAVNGVEIIGMLQDGTLAAIEEEQLIGLDISDGSLRWSQPISGTIDAAMPDARHQIIYTANQFGTISSYHQPDVGGPDNNEIARTDWSPLWSADFDFVGFPTLMPLSDGGIAVAVRGQMVAISAEGQTLWEIEDIGQPFDWALTEDGLVFSTIGDEESLWTADGEMDPVRWNRPLTGRFVAEKNRLWLLEANGIYQLDTQSQSAERLLALPPALLNFSDLAALPDGRLLLVHSDRHDRRLILLDSDNSVRWERSIAGIGNGKPCLRILDDQVYLLSQNGNGFTTEIALFSVDIESAELTRIFTGGTRTSIPQNTFVRPTEDGLILLNIGGGSLAAIDPELAHDLVSMVAVAQ